MSTIVIAGAAGRIGFNAARAFVAAGWTVRGIARGEKLKRLPQGVEPVEADAFDRQAMIDACAGADVILHALNPTYDKWATHVVPMAENVLAAAKAAGATLMLPGNVYNFGTGIGVDMTEDAPMPADTEKGRLRVDIEEKFRAAAPEGVQTIVLRAGDFFGGPVDGSWLDLVIAKDLRKNRFVWPGRRDVPHAFAYLPDFGLRGGRRKARGTGPVRAVPPVGSHGDRRAIPCRHGGGGGPSAQARVGAMAAAADRRPLQPSSARGDQDALPVGRAAFAGRIEAHRADRHRAAHAARRGAATGGRRLEAGRGAPLGSIRSRWLSMV